MTTLLLTGAVLADGRRVDVRLADGLISEVRAFAFDNPHVPDHDVVDLDGYVLLPSFVEPHAHLDKALTVGRSSQLPNGLVAAIAEMDRLAADFDEEDIVMRSDTALREYLAHGVTAIRTHVTLGGGFELRALPAMARVRERWRGLVDVQLVGMASAPTTEAQLWSALEAGVDALGSYPHVEPDPIAATRLCLRVAASANIPVDLHVDENLDPDSPSLSHLAALRSELAASIPVTASHCTNLGVQPFEVQRKVAESLAAAGIPVICCPQTNLYLLARDQRTAPARGLTAVRTLVEAGVVLAAGGDNLRDVFHPLGRADPLEAATLLVSAGHLQPHHALAAITRCARVALGLPAVEIEVGAPADLVAVRGASLLDALARSCEARLVWRAGREVARTQVSSTVARPGR